MAVKKLKHSPIASKDRFKKLDDLIELSKMKKFPQLTAAAKADVLHLCKRAQEGRPLSPDMLREFMLKEHGIDAGRTRLRTLITSAGGTPWFTK